jgi:hypothetical protein
MKTTKIETGNVTGIIEVTQQIGDTLATKFNKSNDLKVAQISLSAYKTAISAAKAQVIYKKLTGSPDSIEFFEG